MRIWIKKVLLRDQPTYFAKYNLHAVDIAPSFQPQKAETKPSQAQGKEGVLGLEKIVDGDLAPWRGGCEIA